MSGTSLDGVDAVLCRVDAEHCEVLQSHTHSFPETLKARVLTAIDAQTTLQEIGTLDHLLGILFADAVKALLEKSGMDAENIEAIGSHGQTL